jgi:hypothetical protein
MARLQTRRKELQQESLASIDDAASGMTSSCVRARPSVVA